MWSVMMTWTWLYHDSERLEDACEGLATFEDASRIACGGPFVFCRTPTVERRHQIRLWLLTAIVGCRSWDVDLCNLYDLDDMDVRCRQFVQKAKSGLHLSLASCRRDVFRPVDVATPIVVTHGSVDVAVDVDEMVSGVGGGGGGVSLTFEDTRDRLDVYYRLVARRASDYALAVEALLAYSCWDKWLHAHRRQPRASLCSVFLPHMKCACDDGNEGAPCAIVNAVRAVVDGMRDVEPDPGSWPWAHDNLPSAWTALDVFEDRVFREQLFCLLETSVDVMDNDLFWLLDFGEVPCAILPWTGAKDVMNADHESLVERHRLLVDLVLDSGLLGVRGFREDLWPKFTRLCSFGNCDLKGSWYLNNGMRETLGDAHDEDG